MKGDGEMGCGLEEVSGVSWQAATRVEINANVTT